MLVYFKWKIKLHLFNHFYAWFFYWIKRTKYQRQYTSIYNWRITFYMYIKHGALGNCPQTWNAIQTVISAIARKKSMWTIANQFLISDDFSAYLDPSGHARDWECSFVSVCIHHPIPERERESYGYTCNVAKYFILFGHTQKMDAVISINCSQQATHTRGKNFSLFAILAP